MLRRHLALAATTVLTAGLLTLAPAHATAAADWETVAAVKGARAQACWEQQGDAWVVETRHNARRVKVDKRSQSMYAFKTAQTGFWTAWHSTNWIRPGRVGGRAGFGFTEEGFADGRMRVRVAIRGGTVERVKLAMASLDPC